MMYTDRQIKLAYKNGLLDNIKNSLIEAEIAKKYSIGTQIAILRQSGTKPEEYLEFNLYAEQCKTAVKERIANVVGISIDEL